MTRRRVRRSPHDEDERDGALDRSLLDPDDMRGSAAQLSRDLLGGKDLTRTTAALASYMAKKRRRFRKESDVCRTPAAVSFSPASRVVPPAAKLRAAAVARSS